MKKKLVKLQTCMLIVIAILSTIVSLCSCEEHDESMETKEKVGNILLSDNTVIRPEKFNSKTDSAIGVIFYVNKDTTLLVGVNECGKYSYSDTLKTIENVKNDIFSKCGMENTSAILNSGVKSPAAFIAETYKNSGWYLPSAGELRALSSNISTITRSLKVIGGEPISDDFYVSSSQDGTSEANSTRYYYCVSLMSDRIISCNKTIPHRVRPIMRII